MRPVGPTELWLFGTIVLSFRIFYLAINHEATSEGTFSFPGQVFSKLWTQLDPERICRTIANASGEKRKATDPPTIQESYKQLKKQRNVEKRQAFEAAVAVKASVAGAAAADAAAAAAAETLAAADVPPCEEAFD